MRRGARRELSFVGAAGEARQQPTPLEEIEVKSKHDHRAQKRSQFSQGLHAKNNRTILLIAGLGLALILLLYVFSTNRATAGASAAKAVNGLINVPLAELANGQAKFFNYVTANNKPIRFFAIKSSDGVYRVAADACDVCYRAKMGYHQDGDDMVCKKCGRHFPSKDVNVVTGGCNPDGVSATVQGDKLVINSSDLDSRAWLF